MKWFLGLFVNRKLVQTKMWRRNYWSFLRDAYGQPCGGFSVTTETCSLSQAATLFFFLSRPKRESRFGFGGERSVISLVQQWISPHSHLLVWVACFQMKSCNDEFILSFREKDLKLMSLMQQCKRTKRCHMGHTEHLPKITAYLMFYFEFMVTVRASQRLWVGRIWPSFAQIFHRL